MSTPTPDNDNPADDMPGTRRVCKYGTPLVIKYVTLPFGVDDMDRPWFIYSGYHGPRFLRNDQVEGWARIESDTSYEDWGIVLREDEGTT